MATMGVMLASPAFALNVLVSNDDGLTSNVKALYDSLKAAGHNVVVSVPCSPQSGRSSGIVMYSAQTINADNDSQITKENGCHNGAAAIGAPAAGAFTKDGYTNGDWHYVHGTPVMATMYGLDIVGKQRWGGAPDVVLSGPNEGQNIGSLTINSGTIGNAQLAASRGIPAIALSADSNTVDDAGLANANSKIVADLSVKLLASLAAQKGSGPVLAKGVALNVNFPKTVAANTGFAFSRIGTYNAYELSFRVANGTYSMGGVVNAAKPSTSQMEDESVVVGSKVSVSAMQFGYEQRPAAQEWLRLRLQPLKAQ